MQPDRERELERELRELGPRIEYPPTPDLLRAVRSRFDEGTERTPRRGRFWPALPALRRAAVAAAVVLIVAAPALSPAVRATVVDLFGTGQAASTGQGGEAAQGTGREAGEAASGERAFGARTRSEKPSASDEQAPSGFVGSGPTFESLDQMVATADLVVMGTVTNVRPGEVEAAGTPEEVVHLNAVVGVDEVLKGPAPEGPVVVKTLELAYSGPYAKEWRRPGERVLLFLSRSRETAGLYIPAAISHDQTAYILQSDDLVATVSDPLSDRVAGLSVPELRREVEEARTRAARGEVKPLEF
jgi:hypothetical protein